ncbi:fibronectin type III domain-containing protein [Nocardioides currus]|uniref:Fibronectin type-III domain-containing protein n=1 Tax=Nocardioides currus TaxID=2133958 RepID=A0A2R7YS88_9ACTN|nr:fibronectin type III domain-containing protein [Nocardioides currus]PUA79163.1 hypothetical protein C7S10_20720 [Nocardioides currus]
MRTISTALASAVTAALVVVAPAHAGEPRPPGRPSSVDILGNAAGALEVWWTAPVRSGSQPIRKYVVKWRSGRLVVPARTTEVAVTGLGPGSYTFRVRAVSRAGAGPWSIPSRRLFVE